MFEIAWRHLWKTPLSNHLAKFTKDRSTTPTESASTSTNFIFKHRRSALLQGFQTNGLMWSANFGQKGDFYYKKTIWQGNKLKLTLTDKLKVIFFPLFSNRSVKSSWVWQPCFSSFIFLPSERVQSFIRTRNHKRAPNLMIYWTWIYSSYTTTNTISHNQEMGSFINDKYRLLGKGSKKLIIMW